MNAGIPTSAVVSARKSSAWSSSAWWSWRRQRTRSSTFVDQSVSSNARRAAAMAASTSAAVASGARPISAPVAGLRIGYVAAVARGDKLAVDEQLSRGNRHGADSCVMNSPASTGGGHSVDGSSS